MYTTFFLNKQKKPFNMKKLKFVVEFAITPFISSGGFMHGRMKRA